MERPPVPKIVKPRRETANYLPIIAVDDDGIFIEKTGELLPREALPTVIISQPSSLVVAHNVGIIVKELDDEFSNLASWNFRAMPVEREVWKPNRERVTVVRNTVISFFGFKDRYHYPLDPFAFSKCNVHELITSDDPTVMKLFQWATEVRAWLLKQLIPMKPTHGGVAALLLRDKRFYPEARRKVPRATNDKARPLLPGNYYRLRVPPWQEYEAIYLDQVSSHHSCARDLQLPAANRLYGSGRFRDPLKLGAPIYARVGTSLYRRTLSRYGLFCLAVINKRFGDTEFPLPCQESPGRQRVFVYSNEIPYLLETGTIIEGIIAAWTSDELDTGLPKYAKWSLAELEANSDLKPWLKPTLLATYGTLASKPRHVEIGHRRAKGGRDTQYPVGGSLINVKAKRTSREVEPTIANVIQRGMIEAETRLRSLRMAALMQSYGFNVLAIYADSVFVETGNGTLPFLPDGWRVQAALTRLRFYNEVSFSSNEVTKLPGIPREDRERLEIVRRIADNVGVR